MEDKKFIQIAFEFLIGILLMVPLIVIHIDKGAWIVFSRILYSFGIMLAMTKLMSMIYRIISGLVRKIMLSYQKSYWMLYCIFICCGVIVWYLYSDYFVKGYFWLEFIAYILFVVWFGVDVYTVKCFSQIRYLDAILNSGIERHKKCVEIYKNDMMGISDRKNRLVRELERYLPREGLRDPLKELRRMPDLERIGKYLQKIPSLQGGNKGIEGLLSAQKNINRFENAVRVYLENLTDDEKRMDQERESYDIFVSGMEKKLTIIKRSEERIEKLSNLGFDTDQFQRILDGDIVDAESSKNSIKQFWKMNKKNNSIRRKNYGR